MSKYNLQANEKVVMKSDRVLYGGVMSSYTNELLLTNLNIVLISKGIFGNSKGIQIFPINKIKIFENEAQVRLGKQRNGSPQLEIYFLNSQEVFGFEKKREVLSWIDNISKLLVGKPAEFISGERNVIPGTEFVAETLKGTVDAFKGALGIQLEKTNKKTILENKTQKCISCRAPISGVIGQNVHCKYCDTEQTM